jgi:hypothetical protein
LGLWHALVVILDHGKISMPMLYRTLPKHTRF